MSDKIKDLISEVEKDSTSSVEQREKAKKVLAELQRKNRSELSVKVEARSETLALLKEIGLDAELTATLIEPSLIQLDDKRKDPEVGDEPIDSEDPANNGNYQAEKLSREGWDDVYIYAKMLSLGYIPKYHDIKHTPVSGFTAPIKWVWANKGYIAMGGPLTNGTINPVEWNKQIREWLLKAVISEEAKLKLLLNSVVGVDTIGDRAKIVQKIQAMQDYKVAINAGDINAMKTASANYANISQEIGTLKKLFNDYGVKETVKKQTEKTRNDRQKVAGEAAQNHVDARKSISIVELERQIKAQSQLIDGFKDTGALQLQLDNLLDDETILKREKQDLIDEKTRQETKRNSLDLDLRAENAKIGPNPIEVNRLRGEEIRLNGLIASSPGKKLLAQYNSELSYTRNLLASENAKIGPNPIEVNRLRGEIQKIDNAINGVPGLNGLNREIIDKQNQIDTKIRDIRLKRLEIQNLPRVNKNGIDLATENKDFFERLKNAVISGDHTTAKNLIDQYNYKHGPGTFGMLPGIGPLENDIRRDNRKYVETQTEIGSKPRQGAVGPAGRYVPSADQQLHRQETRDVRTKAINSALDKEITRITTEIQKIEDEIDKIRKKAEKQLQELELKAKQDPSKVPELRAEFEKTVGNMNIQITELEKRGVDGLKKLNPEELKLLSTKSKWTENMLKANGGFDKLMSGGFGKILGVGAIIMLAGGITQGVSNTGLSSETALNLTDIGLGMLPIVGGAYDICMAVNGEDLNGVEMTSSEKWTRFGFGVVGLVPLVGTVVKWSATGVKATATATKLAQRGELITEAGHFTGKLAGIGALGRGGISTTTYVIDYVRK